MPRWKSAERNKAIVTPKNARFFNSFSPRYCKKLKNWEILFILPPEKIFECVLRNYDNQTDRHKILTRIHINPSERLGRVNSGESWASVKNSVLPRWCSAAKIVVMLNDDWNENSKEYSRLLLRLCNVQKI